MRTGNVDYIGKSVDGKTYRQGKVNTHSLVVQKINIQMLTVILASVDNLAISVLNVSNFITQK